MNFKLKAILLVIIGVLTIKWALASFFSILMMVGLISIAVFWAVIVVYLFLRK